MTRPPIAERFNAAADLFGILALMLWPLTLLVFGVRHLVRRRRRARPAWIR